MRSRCRYVASTGESVELDARGSALVGTAEGLRGNAWSYSVGPRSVSSARRAAREETVDAYFADPSEADRLRRLADADMAEGKPGAIWVDDVFQRAYIAGFEASGIFRGRHSEKLRVVLLDGAWSRPRRLSLTPSSGDASGGGADSEFDLMFDAIAPKPPSYIENASSLPAPARITFWGPAINPYVVIGKNRYAIEMIVQEGARVEVNGTSWPRTIKLIGVSGDSTDAFAAGERGSGRGCGEYVFEDVAPGSSQVSWPGSYGVDIEWHEQEGAPPWSL